MHLNFRRMLGAFVVVGHCALAAAADRPLPNPVLNPDVPWVYGGFSVNAPAGHGWVSYLRNGSSAAFGKSTEDDSHVYGINVLASPSAEAIKSAEDLAERLRASRPTLVDLEEFNIREHQESPASINGYWCSQYKVSADAKTEQTLKHLYIQGVTCANPNNLKQMVDVAVSDLTIADAMATELFPMTKPMIESIKFLPRISKQQTEEVGKAISGNDHKKALALLQPRASSGDSRAAYLLADIYLNAKDVQNYVEARKWLELSAGIGERDALYQLGVVFDKGLGVERNVEQAVKWFKLAADQRDPQAQLNLGILHDPRADGIAKDSAIAAQWFLLAANNGNQRARQILEKQYVRKPSAGGGAPQ